MNQTISQRRELRRAAHQWRRNPRPRNGIVRPAHPRIAGALATFGEKFAAAADRLIENTAFIVAGLIVASALLWARVEGVL